MAKKSLITEEMRKAIGTWHLPQFPPETVGKWAIGRYLDALEDENPLWVDEEYARKTSWGGIIAPPTFIEVFNPIYLNSRAGCKYAVELPFKMPLKHSFLASEEYEFLLPLRLGDIITGSGGLGDVYEEDGERGQSLFTRIDKEYRNQKGELVVRTKSTTVAVDKDLRASADSAQPGMTTPQPAKTSSDPSPTQVYFEDVEVGTELPSMIKEIPIYRLSKWAGATGDLSLEHIDCEHAKKETGQSVVTAHEHLIGAYLALLITNWLGGWGIFKKHHALYKDMVWMGDTLTFKGKVAKKYTEGSEHLVECESVALNRHGKEVALGKSLVTLPMRNEVPA
ncbi:MaoC family dehydratase N-terminal domain-containing protein [Chloroflexota bacterium]